MRFRLTSSLVLGLAVVMAGGCSSGRNCRTPLLVRMHLGLGRQCVHRCDCCTACAYNSPPTTLGDINFADEPANPAPLEQPMVAPPEAPPMPPFETQEGNEIPVAPEPESVIVPEDSQASHHDDSTRNSSRLAGQHLDPTNGELDQQTTPAADTVEKTPAIGVSSSNSIFLSREPVVLELPPEELKVEEIAPVPRETLPAKSFENAPSPNELEPISTEDRMAEVNATEANEVSVGSGAESMIGSVEPEKHLGPFPIVRLHATLPPAHDQKVSPIVRLLNSDAVIVRGSRPQTVVRNERSVPRIQNRTATEGDQVDASIQSLSSRPQGDVIGSNTIDR